MKHLATAVAVAALAAVLAACSGATAAPSGAPVGSVDPDALRISSVDMKFSTDELVAPAGKPFTIVYENQEAAPHNVAIYTDGSASEQIFAEEPFSGPKTVTYSIPALDAGTYYFQCDLHTDMNGTLVVR